MSKKWGLSSIGHGSTSTLSYLVLELGFLLSQHFGNRFGAVWTGYFH